VLHADIYGSRAKGSFRPGSDIDLSLFGEALTAQDLLQIDREIDALDLPYKVDLSLFAEIDDPALRAHITRVGQVLYQRTERGVDG
jgi:predicted nucleotidyltransferase